MANTNTPYVAKNAGQLVNPTTATVFQTLPSANAIVASTQVLKPAYAAYKGYAQTGSGTANNINTVNIAIRAIGQCTYGAAGNYTPSLVIYPMGTRLPALTITPITLGAIAPQAASAAGTGTYFLAANLLWSPTAGLISGTVNGYQTVLVNGVATTLLTSVVAITPQQGFIVVPPLATLPTTAAQAAAQINNGGEAVLFIGVAGIFSTSNANNLASLDGLTLEGL